MHDHATCTGSCLNHQLEDLSGTIEIPIVKPRFHITLFLPRITR